MWRESLDDANKLTYLKPDWPKSYLRKGVALQGLGKFTEAQYALQKGLHIAPTDPQLKAALSSVTQSILAENFQKAQKEEEEKLKEAEEKPKEAEEKPKESDEKPEEKKEETPEKKKEEKKKKKSKAKTETTTPEATTPTPTSDSAPAPAPAPTTTTTDTEAKKPESDKKEAEEPEKQEKTKKSKKKKDAKPEEADGEKKTIPPKKEIDLSYYTTLGVEQTATMAEIKKAYYKKAKDCHPDKTDDPNAEEIFKELSAAYATLSDESKRKLYDQYGKAAMDGSSPGMDMVAMLRVLFGGGCFDDTFGEIQMITMMSLDEAEIEAMGDQAMVYLETMLKSTQEARVNALAEELAKKLDSYTEEDKFKCLESEIGDKADAPGGPALLGIVGYIYVSEAKKRMGRYLGVEGVWAGIQETGHNMKVVWSMVSSEVQLEEAQHQLEKKGRPVEGEDGEVEFELDSDDEAVQAVMNHGMAAMWKMGRLDIEDTCRSACKVVFKGDKKKRKSREKALYKLGKLYKKTAAAAKKATGGEGDYRDFVNQRDEDSNEEKEEKPENEKEKEKEKKGKQKKEKASKKENKKEKETSTTSPRPDAN
eukprot:TRINITY_DN1591_c1_g1_i1.p1 TRINITY_DN1591_c1_g1~~TRINITY_DN1591_c1_g1_i1.p1  ORF type:complete len:649 (-),score=239.85 TRINITY_DN1591_c1_g1_i1:65-1840(-)